MGEPYSELTGRIIDASIEVHRTLGPGLLESTYRACLAHELTMRGHDVRVEYAIPVTYKGYHVDCGYRVDVLVDDTAVVELKAIERLHPVHQAQVLTYLRLAGLPVGLLINFNQQLLKDGLRRLVNADGKPLQPQPRKPFITNNYNPSKG